MKKLYTLTVSAGLALILSGCGASNSAAPSQADVKASDAYDLDVTKVCDAKSTSAQAVLGLAKKFNPIAVKNGVEFMRFGMPASVYIAETQKAIDTNATEVVLLDKDGKATKNTMSINDAANRACKFAITALKDSHASSTEWKLAVPGDGYQY
ncbi:MAG: hypothetical protein HY307_02855 [Arcobacter sp.]|nr:hypothetical protein [Arcobacter sp.]